jgi:hypothetical protein
MNPIEQLLNQIIQNMLPQINSGIQSTIRNNHLDPWGQIASGNDKLGSLNIGICDASAWANYNVGNMRGLSAINVNSIILSQTQPDPNDPSKLLGVIQVNASMGGNLSANLGGGVEAKCGFIHPSVGISGSATVSGLTASAAGFFSASVNGNNVCLNSISMSNMNLNYGKLDVYVNGLGIFNTFLSPLIQLFTNLFKGQINSAIANALKPMINGQVNSLMPQCKSL